MYTPANVADADPLMLGTYSKNSLGLFFHGIRIQAPSSSTFSTSNRIFYVPFFTSHGYSLARWWWQNGATVGTNYIQTGIYDENLNLFRASPRTLSAGTVNQLQFATPGIHGVSITNAGDVTDSSIYTTSSVTLKAGMLYLMAVENSAASAGAVSSIDSATGGYPTFTSRSTTQYNTAANRVSIWSAAPTSDFTGTLRINFGATQTGAVWALNGFYHVDTTTTDGIVQNAVGTGSSVTPLATLSAFGSAQNVALGAFGQAANSTGAPTSVATLELSDNGISTPAQALQTIWATNDTTMDETITSVAWGACAVEIKSLGTGAVYVPPMRGYLAFHCNGTTAAVFQKTGSEINRPTIFIEAGAALGLPVVATPVSSVSGASASINHGFTRSTSP